MCGAAPMSFVMQAPSAVHELIKNFPIFRCHSCAQLAIWPQPSDTILEAAYKKTYYSPHGQSLIAQIYNSLFRIWSIKRLRALARLKPSGRFLDIGCGAGQLVKDMLDRGYDAYGMDTSASLTAVLPDQIKPRIQLKDLTACNYPAASFDLMMLSDVLEHVRQPLVLLQTIHHLLKKDGYLIISVPNWNDPEAYVFGRRFWHNLDAPRHLWHFTSSTLARLTKQAGFSTVQEFDLGLVTLLEAPLSLVHGWQRWLRTVKISPLMRSALFLTGTPIWLVSTPIIRLLNVHRPRQLRVILKKSNLSPP